MDSIYGRGAVRKTYCVMVKIDAKTGKRVSPNQQGIYEFFKSENVPAAPDDENASNESEQQPLPDDLF